MLTDIYEKIGFSVCHQISSRTIFIDGLKMPVDARMTGMFVGFLAALILLIVLYSKSTQLPSKGIFIIGIFACTLLALDGLTSYLAIRETTNTIRLLTGLFTGSFLALILYPTFNDSKGYTNNQRVLGSPRHQLFLLLTLTIAFLLIINPFAVLKYVLPTVIITGILSSFILLNLTIANLFKPTKRHSAIISLSLTAIELSITYKLHSFVNNALSSIG